MRVAATLDHPAIVRLLESVEDDDYIYVVFELVRGDDLARAFREGMLDDAAVMRAVAAVCDALAHAHERGVVHRDIKPGNVLLRDDGILKLTDFGIALVSDPDATVDDRLLGTLSYMAPEQALGENVDGAADIFSSALMLYEALAGANPFRAKTPQELADASRGHLAVAVRRPSRPAAGRAAPHRPRPAARPEEAPDRAAAARRAAARRPRDRARHARGRAGARAGRGPRDAALRKSRPRQDLDPRRPAASPAAPAGRARPRPTRRPR